MAKHICDAAVSQPIHSLLRLVQVVSSVVGCIRFIGYKIFSLISTSNLVVLHSTYSIVLILVEWGWQVARLILKLSLSENTYMLEYHCNNITMLKKWLNIQGFKNEITTMYRLHKSIITVYSPFQTTIPPLDLINIQI